jgi:hypothetical protein
MLMHIGGNWPVVWILLCKKIVKNISLDPLANDCTPIVGFRPGTVVGPFSGKSV